MARIAARPAAGALMSNRCRIALSAAAVLAAALVSLSQRTAEISARPPLTVFSPSPTSPFVNP